MRIRSRTALLLLFLFTAVTQVNARMSEYDCRILEITIDYVYSSGLYDLADSLVAIYDQNGC